MPDPLVIVDGNNVMGSRPDGWWKDRAGAAARLVAQLGEWAARSGREVLVVFDGAPPAGLEAPGAVEVRFARRGGRDAADDEIAAFVAADAAPQRLRVVTSDAELARRVRAHGAEVIGARRLLDELDRRPDALDRTGYEVVFDEDFSAPELDPARWVAHYLPQWTTPERSAARYDLAPGVLRLRIDADQPAWRVGDGQLRVSNLQTGTFSGPLGSPVGQHRHRPDLTVATPQPTRRMFTPSSGLVEAVLRASADPACLLAFWLVGFEESPEQSGEICVCELFGDAIEPQRARVRMGVKAHDDPRLREDMEELALDLDATAWHSYAAEWTAEGIRFFVDDRLVRTVEQRIDYPLQLMVDLFEFPEGSGRDPAAYPKTGEVKAVRGYRRAGC
jgi:predicted RNA-binding protein with PIN domain